MQFVSNSRNNRENFSLRSGEAAAADGELAVPRRVGVRAPRVPRGGAARLLPLVRHAGRHERALPGAALRHLRVRAVQAQPAPRVRAPSTLGGRRVRGRAGRRRHHAAGRLQDGPQHAGTSVHRPGRNGTDDAAQAKLFTDNRS